MMKSALEGNFPAKLEFEDDSFELTVAELSNDGSVRCNIKAIPTDAARFRLAFVVNDILNEFDCDLVEIGEGFIVGKLSQHNS